MRQQPNFSVFNSEDILLVTHACKHILGTNFRREIIAPYCNVVGQNTRGGGLSAH